MKEVEINIIKPLEVQWKCPVCKKYRYNGFVALLAKTRVKCNTCGKEFEGVVVNVRIEV